MTPAMREYVMQAKARTLRRPMDTAAEEVLDRYFCRLRRNNNRAAGPGPDGNLATVRTLQGLLRLSQAHAKLLQNDRVTLEDAVAVVWIHNLALHSHAPGTARILVREALGPAVPCHLRRCDLRSDITCCSDYVAVEGAVLWALGLRKDSCSGEVAATSKEGYRHPARGIARAVKPGGSALAPPAPELPSRAWREKHLTAGQNALDAATAAATHVRGFWVARPRRWRSRSLRPSGKVAASQGVSSSSASPLLPAPSGPGRTPSCQR